MRWPAWRSGEGAAATLAAAVAAVGLCLAWAGYAADRRDVPPAGDTDVAAVADRLADEVGAQWSVEAKIRGLNRPPLALSWQPADPSLVQPWPYLQRLASAGAGWTLPANLAAGPHELAGAGSDLIAVFDRLPIGRLVVLGEPGAGKTMLLLRLVLDLLARRSPGGAAPLLVPVASRDPGRRGVGVPPRQPAAPPRRPTPIARCCCRSPGNAAGTCRAPAAASSPQPAQLRSHTCRTMIKK